MKQAGKRICSLLLAVIMLFGIFPTTPKADAAMPSENAATVKSISVTDITDGSAPFDEDNAAGNDSGANNKIVRSFDSLTYRFDIAIEAGASYTEAYVRIEFTLPLSKAQAEFDTAAMGWMETTGAYAYQLTDNGNSQTLVCYKHLENNGKIVVPGNFNENLSIKVKGMANGSAIQPEITASVVGNSEDKKKTVTPDVVTVSAAARFNIKVSGKDDYKDNFNFNTGNTTGAQKAPNYGISSTRVPGRVMALAVCLELYNDKPDKGFKGVELPNGEPITFKLRLGSTYTINDPNDTGYTRGQIVDVASSGYMPLLYSVDGNVMQPFGTANGDGRILYNTHGALVAHAPYNVGGGPNACRNGGVWTAKQLKDAQNKPTDVIEVTVSGYEIDVDQMPVIDGDRASHANEYGKDKGIGVFSAGEFWIVQPFNELNSTNPGDSGNYDIVKKYGEGAFTTFAQATDLKITTVNIDDPVFQDTEGTNDQQQVKNDDKQEYGLELRLPGFLQNRVYFADSVMCSDYGVNVSSQRHGDDVATAGTEFYLRSGFTYSAANEEDNRLYWGTNLVRFTSGVFELTGEVKSNFYDGAEGQNIQLTTYYAAKTDGTGWASYEEMKNTTEEGLVFYPTLADLNGKECVALLHCFKGPGPLMWTGPYYLALAGARVRDNVTPNTTAVAISTSRVWTQKMWADAGSPDIPVWTSEGGRYPEGLLKKNTYIDKNGATCYLNSGNVVGSTYYQPATYDEANNLSPHNSDWGHWGDTMLFIGYKTGVTMTELQKVNGSEKETYALDKSQREADFVIQPRASFDKNSGDGTIEKTTDLTVTLTLPKYMTYINGSAYWGGTYTQTNANGGVGGTVSGGTAMEPQVVNNADGSQTLTWILQNVTVGAALDPIYYSAYIGSKLPAEDCPLGTTSLAPTVTISGTEDRRAFTADNGNIATQGITVTKGSADAFTKSVKADKAEADGTVDYVIYSTNNGTSDAALYLLDTMPCNEKNGSSFTGTYHVTGWKLDTALCDVSKLAVYYTEDPQYVDKTAADIKQSVVEGWTKATLNADGTLTDMNGKRPTAWAIIGTLDSNKAVNVELQIQLVPEFDTFVAESTVYVNTISEGELVATAEAKVVERTLSGMVWSDDDGDGVKTENADTTDTRCDGTTFYSVYSDPILYFNSSIYEGRTADKIKQVKVVMSGSPKSSQAIKLYFEVNNSGASEDYRVEINNPKLIKDAGEKLSETEKEYVFNMSDNPNWKGTINAMRLDPVQGTGLYFNIKSVTFVFSDGTEQSFDFCTKGAYQNCVTLGNNLSPTPIYPSAEDITLPQEAVFSTKRLGTTFRSADDDRGDLFFTFRENMFYGLSTADVQAVRVTASGDPAMKKNITLYYATGSNTGFSEEQKYVSECITQEETTYTFALAGRSDWTGALNGLRIDLIQGPNLDVTLKSIMIDLTDGTTRTFDFTVDGAWETYLKVTNMQGTPVTAGDASNANAADSVKVSLYKYNATGGTTFRTGAEQADAILTFQPVMYQGLKTSDVKSVRVVMSGSSANGSTPDLYYASGSEAFAEERKINLNGQSLSGEMKEYVFSLDKAPYWAGDNAVKGFRLDPLQATNASFTIRSISIELTDGSMRTFDFTEPDAYKALVTPWNLESAVSYLAVDPNDPYSAVTYPDGTPVTTYLGQSVSAKNKSVARDSLSGSYEFRDLPGGTYMVRFESGTTNLSGFDKATNAVSLYDAAGKLVGAELRNIELPKTLADYDSTHNDVGFYGKTDVVLNYDRKVAVDLRSYRSEAPVITLAEQVDATVWSDKLSKTDADGKEDTFAEIKDGKLHITPYALIYSKDNPDASVFYKLSYPDGTSIIHEVKLKPADVIYYEESNDDLITFTDGKRGIWYKVTGKYSHGISADAEDYVTNADGQYQDADTHTDDYDSKYSGNGNNLYFSAGTARMVNVTSAIQNDSLVAHYPSMRFTFFGTGFELVSMGTPYGGVINVQVYEGNIEDGEKPVYTRTVNTRYGVYFGEQESSEVAPPVEGREVDRLYQGTALVKDDLTYGMYTVVCTPMYSPYYDPYDIGSFDILVDGVRILNPIGTTPEYERTDFNDILTSGVSLFITEYGKTELSDKLEHGPKYEIHLAPQQSIAVAVTAEAGATLRVGAQSFTGAAGKFSVYSVENFTDEASKDPIYQNALGIGTEMHYPVRTWETAGTQILLFKNTGNVPIALTSFEYLPDTVTALSCRPEVTNAALPLAQALLPADSLSTLANLNITAASLSLSSDISINFYVPEENLADVENPYMVCVKQLYDTAGNVVGTEEKELTDYAVKDGKRVYTFNGISAMEMGSMVTATMHGTKGGAEVTGNTVVYSVKTYATNQLNKADTSPELSTLLVDMLNYGASAQSYWNYNTANPANAGLTVEQQALATQTEPTLTDDPYTISGNDTATVKFTSAALVLKEKVAIKYYMKLNGYTGNVSDLTMKLTCVDANGKTQTATISGDKFTKVNDDSFAVVFDGLNATQMRTVCTAEIFDREGTKVSGKLTYSIEAYAARKTSDENSSQKLVALLKHMMQYGDSTYAYFDILTVPETQKPQQAYELCFADSLDNPAVLEGIESGWEIDNRAGMPKLFTTDNGTISDVMTDEHSRLLRYFNRVTEGRLDLQFKVCYSYGFNGNVLRLCDEDDSDTYYLVTKDNAFWLKTQTGELQQISGQFQQLSNCQVLFRVIIDLDRHTGTTYINNQLCGTYPLTGSGIRYLSFETLDETRNTTKVYGGYIQANYAVYESFNSPTAAVNCEFTNANQLSLNGDALSLPGRVTTSRSFAPLGGKVSFHCTALLPDGSTGSLFLCAGETSVVEVEAKNGWLYANGHPLKAFSKNLWYDLRVEADIEAQRAVIKVSNQVVDTVDFRAKTNYVDGIRFANSGEVAFSLDNIMVNNLLDYDVPEPVIPAGADDYTIGINVCSLWENGSHWGWATVTPHDDLKPVLGYYDEGLPETADWEIKFMAEHGIDFQAFCWYARQSNAPLTAGYTQQLDAYLNSKYSDKMKFCLLWEAANGARPADSAAFRNYYVPHWIENYFSNPNYMVIDNKPVLAIFGSDKLIAQFGTGLKAEFDYLRDEVKKLGFDGMIILECNGWRSDIAQYGFDGWYAYNWGREGYSLEHNKNSNLNVKKTRDVYTVPTISVGFNDVGWHQTRNPLMTVSDYEKANKWVRDEYLPKRGANAPSWSNGFVMLSTWNEYGEGTYLMPAEGLNGFGYLDVIRDVYTKGGAHEHVVPTAEQKAHINHNYPQDRRVLRRNGNYVIPESSNKKTFDFTQAGAYNTYLTMSSLTAEVTVSDKGTTFKTLPAGQSNDAILGLRASMYEGLTADDVTRIRVVASGIPAGQSMQLFFATKNAEWSEANSIRVTSTTTEETTFLFDVGLSTAWTGTITGLRLDPLQVNDTSFTIKSITFELAQDYPELYINGIQMKHTIYPETHDNVDYFPFEPGVSLIQYQLYTYYEWDYATSTLTLYRDQNSYTFTAGKDYALINGVKQVPLGGTVYLQDGVPMLPTMGLAKALGLHCAKTGNDYLITTPEASLYTDHTEGVWRFNQSGASFGWTASLANQSFGSDCMILESEQKPDGSYDPMLVLNGLKFDCSKYKTLQIRCKWSMSSATSGYMKIYFATQAQPSLDEGKTMKYQIGQSSDGYQTITFDMSLNPAWAGTLTQLRFDPFDAAGTVEIAEIRFAEAEEEEVLLQEDAESGENVFFSENAKLQIVEDPEARYNQCYHVTGEPKNWLYMQKSVTFTPGTTYQIDFDVMLDPNGKNESSEVFCNMRYLDADGNKDHIVKQLNISKSDGWLHYSATYTVPASSVDRSYGQFTIYSNPKGDNNENETAYYVDNVKVVALGGGTSSDTTSGVTNGAAMPFADRNISGKMRNLPNRTCITSEEA